MLSKVVKGFEITYEALQAMRSSEAALHLTDAINFAFGFIGIQNLVKTHWLKSREIDELTEDLPPWQQRAWKIADFFGNISLILSGLKSPPAIAICQWSFQLILSSLDPLQKNNQLGLIQGEKILKIVGLISFLFGIPSTLKTLYSLYSWIKHRQVSPRKHDEHLYTPVPIKKLDMIIMMKTVAETARKILKTSPKR
jgi:hypothetical protein